MIKKLLFSRFSLILVFLIAGKVSSGQIIFSEDWSSGSFATNGWTLPTSTGHWFVGNPNPGLYNPPVGATQPYAYFDYTPTIANYDDALVSPVINATAFSGGSVFISYKLNYFNYQLVE